MDTDSAYFALSGNRLDNVVKPEFKEDFKENKHLWLGRDDAKENVLYDRRTPGLFKLEYEGDGIITLASKMYYCFGDKDKFGSMGLNKQQNEITKQKYLDALQGDSSQKFTNKGFRVMNNEMNTYELTKNGMKLFNDKRLRVGKTKLDLKHFHLNCRIFKSFTNLLMDELVELYYNPKIGLTSPYKLYIKLKKHIPLKTIEEFAKKQEIY